MKLILQIGPDTIGISRYKSKKDLKKYLQNRRSRSTIMEDYTLDITIFGHRYSSNEVKESEIFTLKEYFDTVKVE